MRPSRCVSVRALTTMARLHGRSPRGTRACVSAPFGHWTRLTVLGALGAEGVVGAMSVEAATNAAVFLAKPPRGLRRAYPDQVLLPTLRRSKQDAVLVMDDLPAHKRPQIRALLDASGFACRYLPAYSPDLNPIEPAWAKFKSTLRRIATTRHAAVHRQPAEHLNERSTRNLWLSEVGARIAEQARHELE